MTEKFLVVGGCIAIIASSYMGPGDKILLSSKNIALNWALWVVCMDLD